MKVLSVKTFPPHALPADNPYGGVISFVGTISGKIVTAASGLNDILLEPSGDDHRQPELMFDVLHIMTTGGAHMLREIDHVINDTTMKLKVAVPTPVSAAFSPLKRMRYTDAKLNVVSALGDPVRYGVLNDDDTTTTYPAGEISIPKDRNGECIAFIVDGTSKGVEVTTSPSEYPQ